MLVDKDVDKCEIEKRIVNVIYFNVDIENDESVDLFEESTGAFLTVILEKVLKYLNNDKLQVAREMLRFVENLINEKVSYLQTEIVSADPDDDANDIKKNRFILSSIKSFFGLVVNSLFHEIKDVAKYKSLIDDSNDFELQKEKTNKINWNGTPGEFGAIFNKLFDAGYIEIVKDKKNMVKVLNEIFEIKNEKGVTVPDSYLYKCFNEKERNYGPGQLKIPLTDNYHTGK